MNSTQDDVSDLILNTIRHQLNTAKIKLWLPPYTLDDGSRGLQDDFDSLTCQLCQEVEYSPEQIAFTVEQLRVHALSKLASRQRFQTTGMATIHVKLGHESTKYSIEVDLNKNGDHLKELIQQRTAMSPSATRSSPVMESSPPASSPSTSRASTSPKGNMTTVKVIFGGKILVDHLPLQEQRLKNGSKVMVILSQQADNEEALRVAKETREAAEYLADQDEYDDETDQRRVKVSDQSGKALRLPKAEWRALTIALSLHEKARVEMKRRQFEHALVLLLEADAAMNQCQSDLLQRVDNVALLHLDIVWCYLCLKSVDELPDAVHRLSLCEECFERSYGRNLERVNALKGAVFQEQALLARLHLLRGVVAFHRGEWDEARERLQRAESLLNELQMDSSLMEQVMTMGFAEREARLGLRWSGGSVEAAVAHIIKRREEREELERKERQERDRLSLQKRTGTTQSGQKIALDKLDQLCSMGFDAEMAAKALRHADNDVTAALQIMQEQPELLTLPEGHDDAVPVNEEALARLLSMGFDDRNAKMALRSCQGNVERATDELEKRGGVWSPLLPQEVAQELASNLALPAVLGLPRVDPDELAKKQLAQRLTDDLREQDVEEHLDLSLEDEAAFLSEYKMRLR